MDTSDEKTINPLEEITRIARSFLSLESWGFQESFRTTKTAKVIYNSEWCRISIGWGGWDYSIGNSIYVHYGRLHALNEETSMMWQGEKCRCWHDFDYALHFLDRYTAAEAAKLNRSHIITDPFYESDFREKFNLRQPEWLAQIHLTIWKQYGKRFFELFDLRQPDLWQQYRQFLKEVYDIKGRNPAIQPSWDKVC